MEEKKKPKTLLIQVPSELHSTIKSVAAIRNISIRKWVLRLILEELKRLDNYK